jgi:hypothetical protein
MRRRWTLVAMFAAALLLPGPARTQVSETDVKAAFLPRFARYVTWPESARPARNEPITLCVIGFDPFGAALDRAAANQLIDGRPLVVRRFASAAGARGCHIAFVQGSGSQSTGQHLAAFSGRPVLTVTDARGSANRGIIHFTIVGGRVRFFIDEAEAAARRIAISSRLLALAVGVRPR